MINRKHQLPIDCLLLVFTMKDSLFLGSFLRDCCFFITKTVEG
jgi:hypothetical protein